MRCFLHYFIIVSSVALIRATPSVTIPAGTLKGTTCSNGASAFLSVPFAIPPVGSLRWMAPQAYNNTFPAGGYDATTGGPLCIQFGGNGFFESGQSSEDCLYLDIWVPPNATNSSNLPVKVWIHGGGEEGGGIQNVLFDGCNLAAHDTLLVSISYRLGPLGFLTLATAGIAGNFGIQDLILGLEWVQAHIAAFGGNPKKLVLFGQSAGATNTFILSTLPNATSLMSSAIWESGYGPQLATPSVVNAMGASYAASLNCSTTDAACLRSASPSALQAAAPTAPDIIIYSSLNPTGLGFQPYVDGTTIPAQPWSVGPKVPMIFGSNSDEGTIFALGTYLSPIISPSNYSSFIAVNFGAAASLVAKEYPLSLPAFNSTPIPEFEAISTILTQAEFHCPAYQAMLKAQSNNIPVYAYLNSHTPSCQWVPSLKSALLPLAGATHTSEIPYVFGNGVGLPQPGGNCSFTAEEHSISEDLIAAWSAMALTGNPSVQGGLQWPQWNNSTSMGVNIVNTTSVGAVDFSQCAFWDMINTVYLTFTNSSTNTTGTNGSMGSGKANGDTRGAEVRVWQLVLAIGIASSILIS